MPSDYVMNRLKVGSSVKTTEHHTDAMLRYFGKCSDIRKAVIIFIEEETKKTTVKLPNGRTKDINLFWLELA